MKTLANARDKEEILRRLRTLRPDCPARWGRMTAAQMVCHLSDSARMMAGGLPVSDATGPLQRTFTKWAALYLPVRWPAGRILTRPEIDQEIGGTKPAEFSADLAELEALVEAMAAERDASRLPPHPIFGPLSMRAWHRWAYLHMDHHLRQFGA